eukprot:42148-Eustigmatos_ZCMA.PRE.1
MQCDNSALRPPPGMPGRERNCLHPVYSLRLPRRMCIYAGMRLKRVESTQYMHVPQGIVATRCRRGPEAVCAHPFRTLRGDR